MQSATADAVPPRQAFPDRPGSRERSHLRQRADARNIFLIANDLQLH